MQTSCHQNSLNHQYGWYLSIGLWTNVSLLTLAAGAFPSYTARKLFAVGLMVPGFVCWACHHEWGPVYIQPSAPLSRDQRASLITTSTWPSGLPNFCGKNFVLHRLKFTSYLHIISLHSYVYILSSHHITSFICSYHIHSCVYFLPFQRLLS